MSSVSQHLLQTSIYTTYHEHSYSYIIGKYIDRNYWTPQITALFPNSYLTNLTDHNYGKGFDYLLYCTSTTMPFATTAFHAYLKEHSPMEVFRIRISMLLPYADLKYGQYIYDEKMNAYEERESPFHEENRWYREALQTLLAAEQIEILNNELLALEVPGISLELKERPITVYDCLFGE